MSSISRRGFLAASAAGVLAGVSLVGCSPKSAKDASDKAAPEKVSLKPADETKETEVLVVGLGASGIMAATSAAKQGARVLAIDCASDMTGTGNINTTAPTAFGSKAQAEANPQNPVTVEEAFKYIYKETRYQESGKVLRAMLDCSGEAIDAAVEAGMPFMFVNAAATEDTEFKNKAGCLYLAKGEERARIWTHMLESAGVEVLFNAQAVAGLTTDEGAYKGIRAETAGKQVDIIARNVILCSGGFLANEEMVKQYYSGATLLSCGMPSALGYGANIAMGFGAAMGKNFSTSINEFGGSNALASPMHAREAGEACNEALRLQILGLPLFDSHGNRFTDEGILNGHAMYSAEPLIRESTYYLLCDQAFIDQVKSLPYGNFIDTSEPTNVANTLVDLQLSHIEQDIDEAISQGWAAKASSVEELAKVFELEHLSASVKEYNAYCEAGFDEQFYKDQKYLIGMNEPPFYLIQYNPAGYLSLGGIKVDERCRAIDEENNPIEHVYVAGTDADLWSVPYTLGGSANGFSIASGWLAGRCAAQDL